MFLKPQNYIRKTVETVNPSPKHTGIERKEQTELLCVHHELGYGWQILYFSNEQRSHVVFKGKLTMFNLARRTFWDSLYVSTGRER